MTMEKNAEKRIENKIDALTEAMMSGFDRVEEQITEIKGDITGMKSEITGIKSDITGMKSEITGTKEGISSLQGQVRDLKEGLRDVRLVQNRHTEILGDHTIKLKRIGEDVEMLLDNDLQQDKRVARLEKDNKAIKKVLKLA